MSDFLNANFLEIQDNGNLGDVKNSLFDLEALTKNNPKGKGRWLAANGKDVARGYPCDSAFLAEIPHGVFTSTARTLTATPDVAVCAASPTYFVAGAAAGVAAAQYTAAGATWIQTSLVSPASCQVNSIFWNGIRWFFGCSGSSHTCVTTGDNPNSTWTEVSSDTTTTLKQAFAYISALALTVMVPNGTGTSVYTIPDGSTTATARTTTSSSKQAICATSNKFFILTATAGLTLQTSVDGVNWVDTTPAGFGTLAGTSIASDGIQTVIITCDTYMLVSNDNGASWAKVWPSQEFYLASTEVHGTAFTSINRVTFINGKFFITSSGTGTFRCAVSSNGRNWFVEPVGSRGALNTVFQVLAYKSGLYVGMTSGSTAALSATEDTTKFRMPSSLRTVIAQSTGPDALHGGQDYVKVAL